MEKRIGFSILAVVLVGLLAFTAWQTLQQSVPEGVLIASGRIEGRITSLTTKTAGRVITIKADEGQTVKAGDELVVLDDKALRERVKSSKENLDALEHRLRAANVQLEIEQKQIPLEIAQAQDTLKEAEARLRKSIAQYTQAKIDAARVSGLLEKYVVSQQAVDTAQLKVITQENAVLEARAALAYAEKRLTLAHLGEQKIMVQMAQRDALRCQTKQAEASLSEQQSYVDELNIKSPLDGTVLTRNIEKGEHVNPGTPLFTLIDLNQLYLKIYIPEPDMGKVQLGQQTRVFVDAYPDKFFPARVSKIAQQAEFTPKNVETREERVKLVFAVELAIVENPDGMLKPGMPADAVVRWQADAEWVTP